MENKIKELEEKLLRKEQECEQLRKTMHKDFCSHYVLGECSQKHHNNCVGRNQCIKDLEQECEALKAELEQYKKSKQASYEQLQKRCNELELGIRKLQKQFGIEILYCKATGKSTFRSTEILKLKQTLTEIKEIAEPYYTLGSKDSPVAQILNKISEVLDERSKRNSQP